MVVIVPGKAFLEILTATNHRNFQEFNRHLKEMHELKLTLITEFVEIQDLKIGKIADSLPRTIPWNVRINHRV